MTIFGWFRRAASPWQYGTCHDRPARRHRLTGAVQFVLWKAGEQGHAGDYWHDFNSSHWPDFLPIARA